eukprot:CAMPEP_0172644022 /NCGR_PEP_ID=MMETSP1068-20121228/238991_1 /TAXON_ID=35684 /ORGANISM="Pseudopedinella elastica, Strain CCMP716" /LENGTH=697 /DNA_ID=CAMNT_0013458203 /DNA_START=39 /DNA_END=2132 /DNA_ORIENTATION=+
MSWAATDDHQFSIKNLPYGVFSTATRPVPRCGVAIGESVLDLSECTLGGLLSGVPGLDAPRVFGSGSNTLNEFMAQPRVVWQATRARLIALLSTGGDCAIEEDENLQARVLVPMSEVTMHLPAVIGDYTDFYSSREHATNVGTMFRGKDKALQPNWLHLPVGYHGRASSVFVSGTDVVRPRGQLQKNPADDKEGSVYGPCRLLDFELETAFFVGGCAELAPGATLPMEEAREHIFGVVLMNDWSARDIQKWEYVPLGPFGAKNFATSISPWVVTMDALEPFRSATSAGAQSDPPVLPYLADPQYGSYDVRLEVLVQGQGMTEPETVAISNLKNLYWTMPQQLVHHAVTGCNLRAGDLLGSGTISGSTEESFGSMLELSWKGTRDVALGASRETRKFLRDGDRVVMRGVCPGGGVGFGEVSGTVLPAGSVVPGSCITAPVSRPAPSRASSLTDFVLFGYWRSSCSWRVRIALAAKQVEYRAVSINLGEGEQLEQDFESRSPMRQVPVLEWTSNGETLRLSQSLAIICFLEEVFPFGCRGSLGSLYPSDPLAKARALEAAETVNAGIQPLQNLATGKAVDALVPESVEGGAEAGRALGVRALTLGLEALETRHSRALPAPPLQGGPYLLGFEAPSVADACLVPQLYNARRFGLTDETLQELCPGLLAVEAACAKHPWFLAAHPDAQSDAPPTPKKIKPS